MEHPFDELRNEARLISALVDYMRMSRLLQSTRYQYVERDLAAVADVLFHDGSISNCLLPPEKKEELEQRYHLKFNQG